MPTFPKTLISDLILALPGGGSEISYISCFQKFIRDSCFSLEAANKNSSENTADVPKRKSSTSADRFSGSFSIQHMKEPIHSPLDPEEESKRAVSPRVRLVAYARFIHDRTLERELNHRSIPEIERKV